MTPPFTEDDLLSKQTGTSPAFQYKLFALMAHAMAERFLLWFVTAGSLGLFVWAVLQPDVMRLVGAAGYTALVYLPLLFRRRGE